MNRTQVNGSKTELKAGDKAFYLAYIAELNADHEKEIAELKKTVEYYAKMAELATSRKKAAIRNAERRTRLNFSYAALLLAGMLFIPWGLWLIDGAMKAFWLWAN